MCGVQQVQDHDVEEMVVSEEEGSEGDSKESDDEESDEEEALPQKRVAPSLRRSRRTQKVRSHYLSGQEGARRGRVRTRVRLNDSSSFWPPRWIWGGVLTICCGDGEQVRRVDEDEDEDEEKEGEPQPQPQSQPATTASRPSVSRPTVSSEGWMSGRRDRPKLAKSVHPQTQSDQEADRPSGHGDTLGTLALTSGPGDGKQAGGAGAEEEEGDEAGEEDDGALGDGEDFDTGWAEWMAQTKHKRRVQKIRG